MEDPIIQSDPSDLFTLEVTACLKANHLTAKDWRHLASGRADFESEIQQFDDNGQDTGSDFLVGAGKDRGRVIRIGV